MRSLHWCLVFASLLSLNQHLKYMWIRHGWQFCAAHFCVCLLFSKQDVYLSFNIFYTVLVLESIDVFEKVVIRVSFCPVSEVPKVSQQDNDHSAVENRDSNKYHNPGMYFGLLSAIACWTLILMLVKSFFIRTRIYTVCYTNVNI